MRDYFDRPDIFGREASRERGGAGRGDLLAVVLVVTCCVLGALLAIALLSGLAL